MDVEIKPLFLPLFLELLHHMEIMVSNISFNGVLYLDLGYCSVVECLPRIYKALNSTHTHTHLCYLIKREKKISKTSVLYI
jgi:hypothetical protein